MKRECQFYIKKKYNLYKLDMSEFNPYSVYLMSGAGQENWNYTESLLYLGSQVRKKSIYPQFETQCFLHHCAIWALHPV